MTVKVEPFVGEGEADSGNQPTDGGRGFRSWVRCNSLFIDTPAVLRRFPNMMRYNQFPVLHLWNQFLICAWQVRSHPKTIAGILICIVSAAVIVAIAVPSCTALGCPRKNVSSSQVWFFLLKAILYMLTKNEYSISKIYSHMKLSCTIWNAQLRGSLPCKPHPQMDASHPSFPHIYVCSPALAGWARSRRAQASRQLFEREHQRPRSDTAHPAAVRHQPPNRLIKHPGPRLCHGECPSRGLAVSWIRAEWVELCMNVMH